MSIAFIGPSGAGKGTHAYKIATRFNLIHISTGDLFRDSLEKQLALGILAGRYMKQGKLVTDEVTDALIEEWLRKADPNQSFLFDGFPRTVYQARFLDEIFDEIDRTLEAVFYLYASDEEIIKRLPGRQVCRQCRLPFHKTYVPFQTCPHNRCQGESLYQRDDDHPDIVKVRLEVFHRETVPLLDYYHQSRKLIPIKSEGDVDEVYEKIVEAFIAVQEQEKLVPPTKHIEIPPISIQVTPALTPERAYPSMDLVLLAPPGSGKGTQAEQLRRRIGLQHIATGDIFRENLKNETDLGRLAKSYMEQGELVPDDVTHAMIQERLSRPDIRQGFILDGFPRTRPQAQALTNMMNTMNRRLDMVIHLKVSDEEIMTRLSGRLVCRNCQTPYHLTFKPPKEKGICDLCGGELYRRADDNPETIRARLKTYRGQTAPLIDYYGDAGLLVEIEGEGEVTDVTSRIMFYVDKVVEQAKARAKANSQ